MHPTRQNLDKGPTPRESSFEVHLDLPAGLGISLVRNQCEELVYALFKGVELNLVQCENKYQINGHVNVIQVFDCNSSTRLIPFRSIIKSSMQSDGRFFTVMQMHSNTTITPIQIVPLFRHLNWRRLGHPKSTMILLMWVLKLLQLNFV